MGKSLTSSSQDPDNQHHTVLSWDVPSRTRRRDFTIPAKQAPVFAPDGGYLASVEGEEKILLRAIGSRAGVGQPRELKKNNHQMGRLVFSPDGKILASYALLTSELKSESWISGRPAILLWSTDGGSVPGALRDYAFSVGNELQPRDKNVGSSRPGGHQSLGPRDS